MSEPTSPGNSPINAAAAAAARTPAATIVTDPASPAMPAGQVTPQQIQALVRGFYSRARAHPELGPVFERAISDWEMHFEVLEGFWAGVLLGAKRYTGHPYPAHMNLGIKPEHFEQWLELFRLTAAEELPQQAAQAAIAKAEHMAQSFRAGLFPLQF